MVRAVEDSSGVSKFNVTPAAGEVASATGEIVTDVVLARAVITAPGLTPCPETTLPTSPGWKFAVAEVRVPEPLVVLPLVTSREVEFSILNTAVVTVAVAAAESTAAVALVTDLMNAPAGMPAPVMLRFKSTVATNLPV